MCILLHGQNLYDYGFFKRITYRFLEHTALRLQYITDNRYIIFCLFGNLCYYKTSSATVSHCTNNILQIQFSIL